MNKSIDSSEHINNISIHDISKKYDVILFDGVCNFCNSSVNFVIDRDQRKKFKFAALQSDIGKKMLSNLDQGSFGNYDSVILIKNNRIYKKSGAALEICLDLQGFWKLLYVFKILPWFIRDLFYDLIAKNRYRWFGKTEACRLPDPELKDRFLS
jgi:predicted DCC family thiol-disulfide oxidoreductase YuxK